MTIQINKFGTTIVTRPSGKEAWLAFQPVLNEVTDYEEIVVDFADVVVLIPSWAYEFITPLRNRFKNRVRLINTENPSIKASLAILKK